LFAAVFNAPIFPLCAIEPVLSRTRATLSRADPHFAVEVVVMGMLFIPMTPRKLVGSEADAVSAMLDPPELEYTAETVRFWVAGWLKLARKMLSALACS